MRHAALGSLVVTALVSGVRADTLYDNGDPSGGFGTAVLSELNFVNQVGDGFSLAADSIVQSVEWWGTGSGNDFAVRIFALAGGIPVTVPIADVPVGVIAGTPQPFPGGKLLYYSATLPDIELPVGEYALSIVDRPATDNWFWAASCEDGCEGGSFRRDSESAAWNTGNWEMSFRLLGIPTPCPDLDGSGDVGFGDILGIIGAWGPCPGCAQDLNGNGTVDFTDILVAISNWGPCP
ncbi:MAG: hypothetical protein GY715_04975 [Planctomycetes bacterium]|nr:hypothetical protein [Planctomycetota bacterium]